MYLRHTTYFRYLLNTCELSNHPGPLLLPLSIALSQDKTMPSVDDLSCCGY